MKQFNYQKGKTGEELAKDYLSKKGFKIIASNFYIRFGEIDLIMVDRGVLVFIEVKVKVGVNFGLPEEMITNKKLAQMKNMANIFVQKNQALAQKHPCWRLDAVCLVLNKNQEIEKINHYENLV